MDNNFKEDIISNHEFDGIQHVPAQRIKVIGVGGGGNNAVNHMFKEGIRDVSFVLINTDKQALEQSSIPNCLVIGPGRGAGGRPERARAYAEDNAEHIAQLFDDNTDMVFITAGMGGGTGTGAAPVIARIAKEMGILTVGIVTIPFLFEGKRKVIKAIEGAREMARNVDALLTINNQRLNEIYPDLDIFNAFARANDTLLTATQSITDIITIPGTINRDFNDVDTTLRDGGTAIISSGYGEGDQRVTQAIEDALHSPLLRNTSIFSSKKILMVLYVDTDSKAHPFNMEETNQLTDFIQNIDPDVDVMWGLYQLPDLGDKVKISILASGFEMPEYADEEAEVAASAPAPKKDEERAKGAAATHEQPQETDTTNRQNVDDTIAKIYGQRAVVTMNQPGSNTKIFQPDELDDESAIADIENSAYTRRHSLSSRAPRRAGSVSPRDNNNGRDSKSGGQVFNFDDL